MEEAAASTSDGGDPSAGATGESLNPCGELREWRNTRTVHQQEREG